MKNSNLTYYLLAILCIMATSCVTDGVMNDYPDNSDNLVLLDGAHINFVLTFPETSTRGITEDDGLINERKIDDIHIYTFQNDKFVEEIKYILISGVDGDTKRIVEGKLSETYTTAQSMEFVVIVNAENKGVTNISIEKGDSKKTLYNKLIFNYEDHEDWSTYIPMWGVGSITDIKNGIYNIGDLTLKRAIAKVNVTVNEGKGIEGFQIDEIILHNYNTQGFCAPLDANEAPFIPGSSNISGNSLTSGKLSGAEGNRVENRFYIPEHKNVRIDEDSKLYLTIKATVKGISNTYTLRFIKDDLAYDVLRNNMYVFNIQSVKMDDVEISLKYEVKVWEKETVDVPSFD